MQPAVANDVGGARRERRDQPLAEAELAAQRHRTRFLHQQRVRAAVDDPAVEPLRGDDAAGAVAGLEDAHADAAPLQLVRGRQPGDAAADDGDVDGARSVGHTGPRASAHPARGAVHVLREHLHVLDRRRRQDAVSEVEDVAGPAADARQDVVGLLEASAPPGRAAASDRGCPGPRGRDRSRSQASSIGMRQSAPMTSPPASRMSLEDGRGAGAEMNRRHASGRPPRKSAACGAARTRDSRRRSACRPTSRTPAPRRRRPRSAP